MRHLSHVLATVLAVSGLCSAAHAQETEPNGSCASAQEGGSIEPSRALGGRLDASGRFTLAVADLLDGSFSGAGARGSRAYQVAFEPVADEIGSISGRLVDAITGQVLGGDAQFTNVQLFSCDILSCFFLVSQSTDALGRFRFEVDGDNSRIPAGAFAIVASADNYERQILDFSVGAGEDSDLGDIALSPPAIAFSDVRPCADPQPQGGVCSYTVRIRNNTSSTLRGLAYSLVGNVDTLQIFEASTRRSGNAAQRAQVSIPARSTSDVTFHFTVPSFLPFNTTLCTDLSLGLEPSPLFNVVHVEGLFCVTKGIFGLRVMEQAESQNLLERMDRGTATRVLPPSLRR